MPRVSEHVEVISRLAKRVAKLDIDWAGAASYAIAHKGLVDVASLTKARDALGNDVAAAIYGAAHAMAQMAASQPEEIDMDDVTVIDDIISSDRAHTEDGIMVYVTVNQLIMRLAAMRDADADVGQMRVMVASGGGKNDLRSVDVEAMRVGPIDDGDYALVLR